MEKEYQLSFSAEEIDDRLDKAGKAVLYAPQNLTPEQQAQAKANLGITSTGGSGEPGEPGFSPIANVTQTASGAVISVTDKSGTTTATITNGKDGRDGRDGADGAKGDKGDKGDTGAQGIQGEKGEKGDTGATGANGKDGVSATHSWNGTTLTITSASGTSSADLKGEKGDKGEQGIQGAKGDTGAKGDKGDTGATGSNGVSATHSWSGTTLTVTSASGTSSANLKGDKGDKGDSVKGDKGDKGDTGAAGVGVSSVKQTTASSADGGSNVVTVTLSNGTTSTFTVKNGSKGSTGTAGYTPVKGTDYWSLTDQESMVQQVLVALGKPVVGEIDANKNITLVGTLASGVYNVKYETADGELVDVGQIEIGGVAYTNQLPISTDTSGAIYNGKGWKENTRLGGTGTETAYDGFGVTGFIPCGNDVIIRVKSNVPITNTDSNQAICFYDSTKTHIKRLNWSGLNTSTFLTVNADGSIEYHFLASYWSEFAGKTVAFCRLTFPGINDNAIVTINEEIV